LDKATTISRRPVAALARLAVVLLALVFGVGLVHAAPCPEPGTARQVDSDAHAKSCLDSTFAVIPCHPKPQTAKDTRCTPEALPANGSASPVVPMHEALLPTPVAEGDAIRADAPEPPTHPVPLYLRLHRLLIAHVA